MKSFCYVLCSKKGYFLTALLGMFFSVFYMEMMICKCLGLNHVDMSVRIRRSLLYLFFIVLFLAVLGYYLGEWIEECRQELQVLLFCGFTAKGLSVSFRRLLIFLELVSWCLGSILFGFVFHGTPMLFFGSIFGAFALAYIFCVVSSVRMISWMEV